MDPKTLYTTRADEYVSFATGFSHQQGITALLLAHDLLRDDARVLDAGCGTGFATLALLDGLARRGFRAQKIDGFDLTPKMLERFARTIRARALRDIELRQGDASHPASLPAAWTGYDLILSVSMLEYVRRDILPRVLRGLRERLAPAGRMIIVITRKNPITSLLIERTWHAQRYSRSELAGVLSAAGWTDFHFTRYPARYFWLNLSNHVVIARANQTATTAA
jgi:SAM-dependent methyltransferase